MIRFQNLYFKEKYENILEDTESHVAQKIQFFIFSCVFLGISSLILGTVASLHETYGKIFFAIDFFVSSVFLLEYQYRFLRSKHKLSFFFHPQRIVELLSFVPFFLGLLFVPLMGLDILKVLRLL